MEQLQERLTLCRSQADEGYLTDCERQLKNFAASTFVKDIQATDPTAAPLFTKLILEHIQCATHSLPGCQNNQLGSTKLGSSHSSFNALDSKPLSTKESQQRTRFLQTAELLTRTHAEMLTFSTAAQLRSTIFNNNAMLHRLCDRPHAALRCLVAAAEVEVEANISDTDQALTHLNLSAVLSSLNRHRDALGHANIAIQLLSRCIKPKARDLLDNTATTPPATPQAAPLTTGTQQRAESLLALAHYNAAVEREHMKHHASSIVSYRSALKMVKEQLPKDHPVIQTIASAIFDASTNSVGSYKLPTPPSGSPRSKKNSPRLDRLALNHLGLGSETDPSKINAPFGDAAHRSSPLKKMKKIKRYGSLEEEVVAKFKNALKNGGRMIHGTRIETMEDIFIAIDDDGSGTVSTAEFKLGLKRLSILLSDNAVDRLMKEIDVSFSCCCCCCCCLLLSVFVIIFCIPFFSQRLTMYLIAPLLMERRKMRVVKLLSTSLWI